MTRKYEFTGETKTVVIDGMDVVVSRIRRLSDGVVGGWLEGEHNLSHDGVCWVYDDAVVAGRAVVKDSAWVMGTACVYDDAVIGEHGRVDGNSVVSHRATVRGFSHVSGGAVVCGRCDLSGFVHVGCGAIVDGVSLTGRARVWCHVVSQWDVLIVGPLGSRMDSVTFVCDVYGVLHVATGCYHGTLDEFAERVELLYCVNAGDVFTRYTKVWRDQYVAAIEYARVHFGIGYSND